MNEANRSHDIIHQKKLFTNNQTSVLTRKNDGMTYMVKKNF